MLFPSPRLRGEGADRVTVSYRFGLIAAHEREAYFMDAQARLDMTDFERQLVWYKAQHLIGEAIEARDIAI